MSNIASTKKQGNRLKIGFSTSLLQIADAANAAEAALTNALLLCAQRIGAEGAESAIARVRDGDASACNYWQYALAGQVAEYLGTLDQDVKAVYLCEYDATPEDIAFSEMKPMAPIHLMVWVRRKTAALNSVVAALDRALVDTCRKRMGTPQLALLLDVQVIDDDDVERRAGYAAMISSLHHKPIQIWTR